MAGIQKIMSKVQVALLFGGVSAEHEVSCLSAASVLNHLDRSRYEVTVIGIDRNGRWYRQLQELLPLPAVKADGSQLVSVIPGVGLAVAGETLLVDVAFLVTHGTQGEDGRLQGLLDCAAVRYTGSGVAGSALGMDKDFAKQIWQQQGFPVVPWLTAHRDRDSSPEACSALFARCSTTLGLPLFVKPANSGSSVGVAKVTNGAEFGPAMDAAFAVDSKVMVEKAVNGREIEVAVLGVSQPEAFGPGEVVPNHEFYDYEAKYLDPHGAALEVPAQLAPEVSSRILELAVNAYRALDCLGFSRVDFFIDRSTGAISLNEINTLPGFTTISMFPRMVLHSGMTYPTLLDRLIDEALRKPR